MIKGVILDAASLGSDIDLEPVRGSVDSLIVHDSTAADEVAARMAGADVIFTNKVVIDRQHLESCPRLKLIAVLATGTNNIDMDAARERGVVVANARDYGTNSVAQHSLMLMLMLATQQPRYQRAVARGQWSQSRFFCMLDYPVIELAGRHLVIVGQGNIGTRVGQLAEAQGMSVTFSARPGESLGKSPGRDGRRPLIDLIGEADVLSMHCPLTEVTNNLVDASLLANARPGLLVINCARGGIVNEADILHALREGRVAGYAADVLGEEPPPAGHPLIMALEEDLNLVITPHNAWASKSARQAIVTQAAGAVQRHFSAKIGAEGH